jgi:hypothetical protein
MSAQEERRALKQRHAARLWSNPAVCGIDVGDDPEGKPVFTVHLKSDDPAARQSLPSDVEMHPINGSRQSDREAATPRASTRSLRGRTGARSDPPPLILQ